MCQKQQERLQNYKILFYLHINLIEKLFCFGGTGTRLCEWAWHVASGIDCGQCHKAIEAILVANAKTEGTASTSPTQCTHSASPLQTKPYLWLVADATYVAHRLKLDSWLANYQYDLKFFARNLLWNKLKVQVLTRRGPRTV